MAVSNEGFYGSKRGQFNAQASHQRFTTDYIRAVNRALAEYDISTNASTASGRISGTEGTIDIAEDREWILSAGVDYWLVLAGHKSGDLNLNTAFAAWERALAVARLDRDQDIATADDDGNSICTLVDES